MNEGIKRPRVRGLTIDSSPGVKPEQAIWVEKQTDGGFRVDFSIVDVLAYFGNGKDRKYFSDVVKRVRNRRRTTLYLWVERKTITISLHFGPDGTLHEAEVQRTCVEVEKSFTFKRLGEAMQKKEAGYLEELGEFCAIKKLTVSQLEQKLTHEVNTLLTEKLKHRPLKRRRKKMRFKYGSRWAPGKTLFATFTAPTRRYADFHNHFWLVELCGEKWRFDN